MHFFNQRFYKKQNIDLMVCFRNLILKSREPPSTNVFKQFAANRKVTLDFF